MSLDLMKLKTRYETSCNRCNTHIGKEWEVYYSKETKAIYCLKCGELLLNTPDDSEIPDDIETRAMIGNLSLKFDNLLTNMQVLHAGESQIKEQLKSINETLGNLVKQFSNALANKSKSETAKKTQPKSKK